MELKDFIKTTIQSVADAARELIDENQSSGAFINPVLPNASNETDHVSFFDGFLPTTTVNFDVAVTEGREKEGSTGGRLKISVVEFGAHGRASASDSTVSRVQFSMRLTLPSSVGPEASKRYVEQINFKPRSVL